MMVRKPASVLALVLVIASTAPPAWTAVNSVTGGIAGVNNGTLTNGDGSADAQIEINGVDLALVKQARDLTGAVLPAGAYVSAGQEIYFVLQVDNSTSFPAADLRITDLIDEAQFTYVAGSLEQTTVASGSDEATVWAGAWSSLTDGPGDDDASATDSGGPVGQDRVTIGAVAAQPNQTVTVGSLSLRAFRFRVTVN